MNRGTPRNILTELRMTGDEYNFVQTIYYVRSVSGAIHDDVNDNGLSDPIHRIRDSIKFDYEEDAAFKVSVTNYGIKPLALNCSSRLIDTGYVGHCPCMPCGRDNQRWAFYRSILPWLGKSAFYDMLTILLTVLVV
jgi:hypothetical protein